MPRDLAAVIVEAIQGALMRERDDFARRFCAATPPTALWISDAARAAAGDVVARLQELGFEVVDLDAPIAATNGTPPGATP